VKRPPGITPPPPPPPVDPPAPAGRSARPSARSKAKKPSTSAADAETAPIDPLPSRAAASTGRVRPAATPRVETPIPPARPARRAPDGTPWWTTPATRTDESAADASGSATPPDANATVPLTKKPRTKSPKPVDRNATAPLTKAAGAKLSPTTPGEAKPTPSLRVAVKERRRYEKAEARRFTQRSRRRRMAWLISGASVAALVVVVLLAAYSPLLAVRTVAVEGVSRLDPATVTTALDDQLGRPLALVDYGAIERDLAQFPYIESYSVEARPPDTLAVRIVERRPVAQLQTDTGFNLIDAAGVTVQESPERIAGFPVLDLTGTEIGSPGFRAAAAVLMSLPDALIAQVDRISGTTPDSVTMVFTGAGQRVVWGDADDSELKARILERLIATQDPSLPVEYDVSSPQSPVIR